MDTPESQPDTECSIDLAGTLRSVLHRSYAQAEERALDPRWMVNGEGLGKTTWSALAHVRAVTSSVEDHFESVVHLSMLDLAATAARLDFDAECFRLERDDAHARLRTAVENLRAARTATERRCAVKDFLAAVGELIAYLLRFLVRVLMLVLSRLLGRATNDDSPVWKPEPIDTAPQITPRGPNFAFPVTIHRGGGQRSTLGSVVLAA